MHAKYEVSISYGSKVIAKVKVDNRQTDRQDKIEKQYAPDHSIRGHKKVWKQNQNVDGTGDWTHTQLITSALNSKVSSPKPLGHDTLQIM